MANDKPHCVVAAVTDAVLKLELAPTGDISK
jgi:hypothetical protein